MTLIPLLDALPWFLAGVGAAGLSMYVTQNVTPEETFTAKDTLSFCALPGLVGVLWLVITV